MQDQFKDVFHKACNENLIPFMIAGINGAKPKKNTVRIIELMAIVIPVVASTLAILWYGTALVHTIKTTVVVLEKTVTKVDNMDRRQYETNDDIMDLIRDFRKHVGENYHGEDE